MRAPIKSRLTSWQVSVAAEAIVAAQFARLGFDVSVQYGADQPEYDLIVARGDAIMKVSVKGSQDGEWGLTQSYINDADYHRAADRWLAKHGRKTALCFVQFKGVELNEMPRMYLARPAEVAARLRETALGRGDTILYEYHHWGARAHAAGTTERIPTEWKLVPERVEALLAAAAILE